MGVGGELAIWQFFSTWKVDLGVLHRDSELVKLYSEIDDHSWIWHEIDTLAEARCERVYKTKQKNKHTHTLTA